MTRSTSGVFLKEYPKFTLEFHYTATPGDPGNISGPPERYCPPEPDELEFSHIFLEVGEEKIDLYTCDFCEEMGIDLDGITDEIWNSLADNEPDGPEEYPDLSHEDDRA